METAAHNNRKQILITQVGTYFGKNLAEYFLSRNHQVFGLTDSRADHELLANKNFTLLNLDLNQPLPSHLPRFDLICFMAKNQPAQGFLASDTLPPDLANVLSYAKASSSQIFVFAPISKQPDFYSVLTKDLDSQDLLSLFLVGDLYGPGMDLKEENLLTSLISQAVSQDKLILANEGQDFVYPAYIFDVISHIGKCLINRGNRVESLMTNQPVTTLEAAYTIQKIAYYHLQKDISLFFSGPHGSSVVPSPLKVQTITSSATLESGLKNTLDFFAEFYQKSSRQKREHPPLIHHVPGNAPTLKSQEAPPSLSESPHLTSKIKKSKWPHPKSFFKITSLTFGIFLALLLIKLTADIFLGVNNLKKAQAAVHAADLKKAQSLTLNAHTNLKSATSQIRLILKPFSLLLPNQTNAIENTFDSAAKTASSLHALTLAAQGLNQNLTIVVNENSQSKTFDLENPAIYFQKAYEESLQAQKLLDSAGSLPIFAKQLERLKEINGKSAEIAKHGEALTHLLPNFTGSDTKSYLLLLQNNAELRPGGGFIGNIGEIEFTGGRLKNVSVDDVYNLDGQLKEKIEPPKELFDKLGVENFYLRDSNWSGDFHLNAQTARDFYKKETGKTVGGVIALDLSLMQEIIKALGPIKLADYNEEITADNLFEKGEFYSEIGFFPGSTQKKDFMSSLTRSVVEKLTQSISDSTKSASTLALLEVITAGISQKHLMFSFDDPDLATYFEVNNLTITLPPANFNPADDSHETRDFLAVSEANIGANKVNRHIERIIDYEMTIGRDADLVGKLSVTYTNNSQAETWPGGKYANFLRVYLLAGTSLEEYSQDPLPLESTQSAKTTKSKSKAPPSTDEINPPQVTTQGNLTVFSKYIEVPIKSTKTVTFTYRIHKNIKLETAPTYHLYIQKQPGTEKDPLEFRFNLPAYLSIKSINGKQETQGQNIQIKTDLATDRQFEVEIAKK